MTSVAEGTKRITTPTTEEDRKGVIMRVAEELWINNDEGGGGEGGEG